MPAEPSRAPGRARRVATAWRRSRRSSRRASPTFAHTPVWNSTSDSNSSGDDVRRRTPRRPRRPGAPPRAGRGRTSPGRGACTPPRPPRCTAARRRIGGRRRWPAAASSDIRSAPARSRSPGRAFLHAQPAALAVVEVERVRVRAAPVELDHRVVGADAVAVVAGEAAAARQAAAGLEQRRGRVEAAGDLLERGLAAGELERRAHRARRVVVVPRVERVERRRACPAAQGRSARRAGRRRSRAPRGGRGRPPR